jgi:hypothetical protein
MSCSELQQHGCSEVAVQADAAGMQAAEQQLVHVVTSDPSGLRVALTSTPQLPGDKHTTARQAAVQHDWQSPAAFYHQRQQQLLQLL